MITMMSGHILTIGSKQYYSCQEIKANNSNEDQKFSNELTIT